MKDIFITSKDGKFGDIVFEWVDVKTNIDPKNPKSVSVKQLKVVTDEYKLLQSLKKLYLSSETEHPLGYGIPPKNFFDENVIVEALSYYNNVTRTKMDSEKISEIISITRNDNNEYEIVIKTVKGSIIQLRTGV